MAGGAKITPGSPKKGGALTKATSPRNKGGDDESIDSALSDDDGSDYDSVSDEENEEKKEEDESETTGTGKRKGKRMIAGETEEEITDKMFRDQARKAELQDTLSQFMEKPKVVEVVKKKEFKNHTWLPIPVYGWRLRRALDCCVHVPLEDAVLESNVGQVRSFLVRWSKRKEGFERINQVDEKGRGALSLALKEGREDIADFIISIGEANPNISDKDTKLKPLHHAVMQDQVNTIQKLAWRSATVDCRDVTGMTPLMLACKLGHVSVCEMLIEMGANCEKKDKSGWTPLHYAAYGGDIDTIDTILDQGVPHRKKDKFGLRPEDWAHFMGHGEAEAFLEEFKPTMDLDRYAACVCHLRSNTHRDARPWALAVVLTTTPPLPPTQVVTPARLLLSSACF